MGNTKERLASLDVLRGIDMFFLVFLEPFCRSLLRAAVPNPETTWLWRLFDHIPWHGFCFWDMIMPLFMFMSGITIPFALAKYRNREAPMGKFWLRIAKRFVLLFILGAMVQGNLLDFDIHTLCMYSNTLQAIAVGYVVAAILYVFTSVRFQIGAAAFLLAGFAAVVAIFGGNSYEIGNNLVEAIDNNLLGHFRDAVSWENGQYIFSPDYHYTWILSSMNFAVTAMLGCFTGMVLRGEKWSSGKKVRFLLIWGAAMVVAALLLDPVLPIIKHIWSSSMVLIAGGFSVLAMAVTYYLVDVKKLNKGLDWLKYYGMNAIVAYCVFHLVNFSSMPQSLLYGTAQWLGSFYPFIITLCCLLIQFLILRYLYRNKIYIRV
ncbi:MAG: DUF5009 domain-containing protein [Bacteroidales bacterium]|nr:DUF5009 domain-containing protein [Bacteroidales bacterium]